MHYLRILLSIFGEEGEEDFQRFILNLLCSNYLKPITVELEFFTN